MQRPETIFENESFVVINKPAGLLSIPDREGKETSLKGILKNHYGSIFTVHRLDRDTSGVIVFAKNETAHKYLSRIFEDREVEKIYAGIVKGSLAEPKGSISMPIMEHPSREGLMVTNKKGKPSQTDYEVLEDLGLYALVQFRIHTGRTHQIRVHMQYLGHPIVCDELYGDGRPVFLSSFKKNFKLSRGEEEERPLLHRLGLHAQRLSFADEQGIRHVFEAPLPRDMRALLQQLRKWKF
ncbi:MAG: RluA family pseudouridine synthase [Bacteroidota bacterium]|nr:RluA family pseudouridine synthase [Bacteroidota bacterium]MDP4215744.1 RluA family pseudouridine synthase [Bacteroidota bacterium]MDP4246095.1 RluA family pseudouridine synthase [Bacteroidota bacterium]MDP4254496.1 RluA family pseudouridine synthase [Bacteroidota bacterium]MDP4259381.1 RluA family pseudouridine synthase [Bacteroidota bacterium]